MCQSLHRRKIRGIGSHNCFATAKNCLIRLVARQYRIAIAGHRVTGGHSEGRIFLMRISGDGLLGKKRIHHRRLLPRQNPFLLRNAIPFTG